jgi:HAD superfamily hydrolase (TIGR01458 family)
MRVDALLLDLDGTLYVGETPLPGAVAAISGLVEAGVPRRYLTNTTRFSRRMLAERLRAMGFPIALGEIFNAATAAKEWLTTQGISRVSLYLPEPAKEDFAGFEVVTQHPEAIVVGDLAGAWTYDRMNQAFRQLLDGARLVALQKNRHWKTPEGLVLDAGAFVAALEYGADTEAVVTGKPSAAFFAMAARSLGTEAGRIAVVGDDIETDVAGAQAAGMRGALVRTGKFREEVLLRGEIRPDWVVDSLGELFDHLST